MVTSNPIVSVNELTINDKYFLLADVRNGFFSFGVCDFGYIQNTAGFKSACKSFFVGGEPLIEMNCRTADSKNDNKFIQQVSTYDRSNDAITSKLSSACDNFFLYSQSLSKAVSPVLEMLADGLYVVYVDNFIPGDGSGGFFWNSYQTQREAQGSNEENYTFEGNPFTPCFLVPTASCSKYNDNRTRMQSERIKKNKPTGGLAYHLSGMYSALIEGHHDAVASTLLDKNMRCIIIEPVTKVLYEESATFSDQKTSLLKCLSSASVNIPISYLSTDNIEHFFLARKYQKPPTFNEIKSKLGRTLKGQSVKKTLPRELAVKSTNLPSYDMIYNASHIKLLTEPMIEALQKGELNFEGKPIVNDNLYNTINTVCDYLEYKDFDRYVDFCISILYNPDLTETHELVANRVSPFMNSKIKDFFENSLSPNFKIYGKISEIARKYIAEYDEFYSKKSVGTVPSTDPFGDFVVGGTKEQRKDNKSTSEAEKQYQSIEMAKKLADTEKNKLEAISTMMNRQ